MPKNNTQATTVETTLEAIYNEWTIRWESRGRSQVRAHLEALVAAVKAEHERQLEHILGRLGQEHADLTRLEAENTRMRAALEAAIEHMIWMTGGMANPAYLTPDYEVNAMVQEGIAKARAALSPEPEKPVAIEGQE